jgi:hypothetical protein
MLSGPAKAIPLTETLLPVAEDVYIHRVSPNDNWDNQLLLLQYGFGQPDTVILLKFNLSTVAFPIAKAKLGMVMISDPSTCFVTPNGTIPEINVYSVTNNGWAQGTVTYNTAPPRGSFLDDMDQTSIGASTSREYTWTDNGTNTLASFLHGRQTATFGGTGDGIASLWLEIGSGAGTASSVTFADAAGVAFCDFGTGRKYVPTLRLADASNPDLPTAVTLTTFRSSDPALNWPLAAGVIALVGLAVAGGVLLRRRVA